MAYTLFVALALMVIASGDAMAQGGQWPMHRHDDGRSGLADDTTFRTVNPSPIWIWPYPEKSLDEPNNVIDDSSPGFTCIGAWDPLDAVEDTPDAYNEKCLYTKVSGTGGQVAKWTYNITLGGAAAKVYVYTWFPSSKDGNMPRTTDANYTIKVNGVAIGTYKVDQSSGGNWIAIRPAPVEVRNGDTLTVELSNKTAVKNYSPNTIVIADAIKIVQDKGVILSSPILSNDHDIVVVPRIESRILPDVGPQSSARDVGVVYGICTEDNGSTANDERGDVMWQWPEQDDRDWVEGGFSSTPAIGTYGGEEVAYVPGADGTIYAIRTTPSSVSPRCVWRGPGLFIDDTEGTYFSVSGNWIEGTHHAGFQGTGYHHIKAVKRCDSCNYDKVQWYPEVDQGGTYAVYVWIPPSSPSEEYIPDAEYKVSVGGKEYKLNVDQRNGGRWVRLGDKYEIKSGDRIYVELNNSTGVDLTTADGDKWYVAADMLKVIPADLGSVEFSSPIIKPDAVGAMIYIGSTSGRVYAIRTTNDLAEQIAWTFPKADENPIGAVYSSPTLESDNLYVGSANGRVYKVKASNGSLVWAYPPDPPAGETLKTLGQISSTVVVGDYVYVCTGGYSTDVWSPPTDPSKRYTMSGRIVALDKASGERKWVYPSTDREGLGAFLYSSPLLMTMPGSGEEVLIVGNTDGHVYAVNARTGVGLVESHDWVDQDSDPSDYTYPDLHEAIYSSPAGVVCSGGSFARAFVGTEGFRIYGLPVSTDMERSETATDPKYWWSYTLYGRATSSPAVKGGRVYIGDTSGTVWAFSTRVGAGGTGQETFDTDHPDFEIEDPNDPATGGEAKPEVDIVTKELFDMLTEDTVRDDLPADLRKHPGCRRVSGEVIPYEWGEVIYVVAWNLQEPREADRKTFTNKDKSPSDPGFKKKTESNCTVIFKSRGPGEESDQSQSFTMSTKGCYKPIDAAPNSKDGYIYWAKYAYVLDNSSPSKPQSPGSRITISVQERPGGNSSRVVPGDSVVPRHDKDLTDRKKYVSQILAINNPLGLVYAPNPDPSLKTVGIGIGKPAWVGVNQNWRTGKTANLASSNGNVVEVPRVAAGLVSHGSSSSEIVVNVCDRSMLYNIGQRIDKFRVERHDLAWSGGPNMVVYPLPWDMMPPVAGPNASLDYPDIRARQMTVVMADSRKDPTQQPVELRTPDVRSGVPDPNDRPVGNNPLVIQYSIPRFQPANDPKAVGMGSNLQAWEASGYQGRTYLFIDSNRDGRVNLPAELGQSSLLQQRVSGARAEAYRELQAQVHVPPDLRVEVVEKTIDIGKVPHGFGFVPNPNDPGGPPVPFPSDLNLCLQNWDPASGRIGFGQWFVPFTAYNLGNVNLLNVRLAKVVQPAKGQKYKLDLYSETVQDPLTGGAGHVIPAEAVVCALDPAFDMNPGFVPVLDPDKNRRTFHKARVGQQPTILRIPDRPEKLPGQGVLPALSVAVPVGTPVGTYTQKFTLYHDIDRNGVFSVGESVGNPIIEVKVTVTEARLTDGTTPGSFPHVDAEGARPPTGDVSPVVFSDPATGDMQLVWASSRHGQQTRGVTTANPLPSDPWYLYRSSLKRLPNDWRNDQQSPSPTWGFANTTTPQWWTPADSANLAFPSPQALDALFPAPPDGAQGEVIESTARFTSPSVALDNPADPGNSNVWLFFGGSVYKDQSQVLKIDRKVEESRVFYTKWENGDFGTIYTTTRDWTMPKYGIRGLANRGPSLRLWSFWYGGNNNKWRIYCNVNPDPEGPNSHLNWTNDCQIPIPAGLTSVAEPSPLIRPYRGNYSNTIVDVVYSGFSAFHKNSDIYLSRYRFPSSISKSGTLSPSMEPLPEVKDEIMERDPKTATFFSRHVDWVRDDSKRPFIVRVVLDPSDPSSKSIQVNVGEYISDSETGARIYNYPDENDPAQVECKSLFRAVIINPEQGTVKFLRAPEPGAVVLATYSPKAYRLTSDPVSDTAPFALHDGGPNPRYTTRPDNPFYDPGIGIPPPLDRLWLFWRRPAPGGKGTGLYYKVFRHSIKLKQQVAVTPDGVADIESITIGGSPVLYPVETDWVKNRLYFSAADFDAAEDYRLNNPNDPYRDTPVTVRYRPANRNNYIEEKYAIRFEEEPDAQGNSFGHLTEQIVNEGQIFATKYPGSSSIWVFWTSTRAGNTDLFYETISPRFYGYKW